MTLKFNGVTEKKTKGCPVCGKTKVETVFSSVRSYYLPSGRYQTFRMGQTYELSDKDAKFLLSYRNAFEVV